jgi:ABC-type nitrate/sulfonate/bicarbonate transport system ATPase subunit
MRIISNYNIMDPKNSHIQVLNLGYSYFSDKKDFVIRNISFFINRGECLSLLGPSGCGKSTIARIVAGHLKPTEGEIIVESKNLTNRPSRRVFLIHQEDDLFPWLTVEKQIRFASKIKAKKEIQELISLVQLSGCEKLYPKQLSGGMKKRLAIARALAVQPDLLILDEPFSSLDYDMKVELYDQLRRIWRVKQTTILLISHDKEDVQNLSNRTIRLCTGRPARIVEETINNTLHVR